MHVFVSLPQVKLDIAEVSSEPEAAETPVAVSTGASVEQKDVPEPPKEAPTTTAGDAEQVDELPKEEALGEGTQKPKSRQDWFAPNVITRVLASFTLFFFLLIFLCS